MTVKSFIVQAPVENGIGEKQLKSIMDQGILTEGEGSVRLTSLH